VEGSGQASPSTGNNDILTYPLQITQRREARGQLITRRHVSLRHTGRFFVRVMRIPRQQQRSQNVASALQAKCLQIYNTLSQSPEVESNPDIPIFCVGSWDFLCACPFIYHCLTSETRLLRCLSNLLSADRIVFSSKEDVRILFTSHMSYGLHLFR
jgi:hypothetical protein